MLKNKIRKKIKKEIHENIEKYHNKRVINEQPSSLI